MPTKKAILAACSDERALAVFLAEMKTKFGDERIVASLLSIVRSSQSREVSPPPPPPPGDPPVSWTSPSYYSSTSTTASYSSSPKR